LRKAAPLSASRVAVPWRLVAVCHSLLAVVLLAGCAHVPNQWREDGPATTEEWESPTARDVRANYAPAEQRHREWDAAPLAAESGAVTHWPLYFEDPFEDKGHGREGLNKYHLGWEDLIAVPYGYSRYTLNWLTFPVSAIVPPPWTLMESDGRLSRQALGYDHDATRAAHHVPEAPPAAQHGQEQPAEVEEEQREAPHS
jgi:hypothetical protein